MLTSVTYKVGGGRCRAHLTCVNCTVYQNGNDGSDVNGGGEDNAKECLYRRLGTRMFPSMGTQNLVQSGQILSRRVNLFLFNSQMFIGS